MSINLKIISATDRAPFDIKPERPKHELFLDEIYKFYEICKQAKTDPNIPPKTEISQLYRLIQGKIDKPKLSEEAC